MVLMTIGGDMGKKEGRRGVGEEEDDYEVWEEEEELQPSVNNTMLRDSPPDIS